MPYIRRDGRFNPERAKYDTDKLNQLSEGVRALGLAYYFTGDERYAEKAAHLLRVWFIDEGTRMNPNMRYAQFVPGIKEAKASGCLEVNRVVLALDGAGLIEGSKSWTKEDQEKLAGWVREMLKYLLESEQGRAESKSPNNHGTWYGVHTAIFSLYVGDEAGAKRCLEKWVKGRIASQIEVDGRQPLELARTNAFDYSRFNILAHEDGAMIGERLGMDLWNYSTSDGRSLRKAIDWLEPYATGEKKWTGQQIQKMKLKEAALVYRRAANAYGEKRYEEDCRKMLKGEDLGEKDLMFPPREEK